MPWATLPGAVINQRLAHRNARQRLTRDDYVQALVCRVSVELEPVFNSRLVPRNLVRHVRLNTVCALLKSNIWVEHLRIAVVLGVKDVEVTVRVRFERKAYAVARMKLLRRVNAHSASARIAHVDCVAQT